MTMFCFAISRGFSPRRWGGGGGGGGGLMLSVAMFCHADLNVFCIFTSKSASRFNWWAKTLISFILSVWFKLSSVTPGIFMRTCRLCAWGTKKVEFCTRLKTSWQFVIHAHEFQEYKPKQRNLYINLSLYNLNKTNNNKKKVNIVSLYIIEMVTELIDGV